MFLIMAGLTGAVLAFQHELDAALNPSLFHVEASSADGERLSYLQMREHLLAQVPGIEVTHLPLRHGPNESVLFYVAKSKEATSLENNQYFVHPYTGQVLGGRNWGDISQGKKNLIPFLYKLHYSLALGTVGVYLLGIVALLWTFDCFVGAWLTFPPIAPGSTSRLKAKGWWKHWLKSWIFKTGSFYKATFTWHRAGGLWTWGLLLVFAWSAVGMNLAEVYEPTMRTLFGLDQHPYFTIATLEEPRYQSKITWHEAVEHGRELMSAQAASEGFQVQQPHYLSYSPAQGVYRYQVRSSLDISHRYPSTVVWFDSNTGQQVAFLAPTGQTTGNTITTWLDNLHFASVGGWLYQVVVSIVGLAVAALSITGVIIWWKKWRARRKARKTVSAGRCNQKLTPH